MKEICPICNESIDKWKQYGFYKVDTLDRKEGSAEVMYGIQYFHTPCLIYNINEIPMSTKNRKKMKKLLGLIKHR